MHSHFTVMFETLKSNHESLQMKVDSMDNTYDKRISNMEVVITPMLADQRNFESKFEEKLQSSLMAELEQIVPIVDEKIKEALMSSNDRFATFA